MNKKKIFYSTILIILISFIVIVFNAFNGNAISRFIGKNVAEKYLEQTYPGEEFRVESGEYNFKFSEYIYPAYKIDEDPYVNISSSQNYSLSVTGFFKPKVSWDKIRYARRDEILCGKLSYEASLEIETLLKSKIPNVFNAGGNIEVIKGQHPNYTNWSKDIILDKPMDIYVTLDSSAETAEDCVNTSTKIQQILAENNYNYSHVTINGNGFDKSLGDHNNSGYVKYSFAFGMDDKIQLKDVNIEKDN
ncbi:MAG: hypothetical protein RSA29_03940 [Clostridium sp.]|uniref:YfjL-like protein n=1 Tax=Clostridium sp. TaxID=1506 RepID=UPI003073D102